VKEALASPRFYRTIDFWEKAAFWLLLALHLLPLCSGRYFPTADGPTHLYNAWLWKAMLLHPDHPGHQVLAFNPNPEPNYLSHLFLAGFLTFLPPWLAEKSLLILYVVGLPLALRYALRGMGQMGTGWVAILCFPFIYSVVLLWGFYNFCLSLGVMLIVLGYWQRHTTKWKPTTVAGLLGLFTLLYTAHPMTYLVCGLLLGLQVVVIGRARLAHLLPEVGVLLLASLPTLLLLCWYAAHKGTETSQPALDYEENLWNWLRLEPIHYFGSAETTYRWLVAGILASALAFSLKQLAQRQVVDRKFLPWILGFLLLLGAYVVLPDAVAGGSVTRPRWGLLSYLALLGGLAAVPWPPRPRLIGLLASSLVATLLVGFRLQKFQAFQAGMVEYQSLAPYLQEGGTILPVTYTSTQLPDALATGTYIPVFSEAINYLAVEHQLISYENYEAATGYFPLVWQSGKAPMLASTHQPALLAPNLYSSAHLPVYVLLQNRLFTAPASSANAAVITTYLRRFGYRLRYRSPNKLLELYQRPANE
jgi:hypothetical protein